MARASIAGSSPNQAGYRRVAAADPASAVHATLILRGGDPDAAAALLSGRFDPAKRGAAGASPTAVQSVEAFAQRQGLRVTEANAAERRVEVEGSPEQMSRAFGVDLGTFEAPDGAHYLSYDGEITIPSEIAPHVMAVLGLDQRPAAAPR